MRGLSEVAYLGVHRARFMSSLNGVMVILNEEVERG